MIHFIIYDLKKYFRAIKIKSNLCKFAIAFFVVYLHFQISFLNL